MNNAEVLIKFKADTSDVDKKTLSVGKIVKGNLISSAILSGLGAVAGGIANITGEIVNLAVKGGFDRALNIEQAEFKLKGLGHSAEEVEEIMDNALKSVKGTAYGLDEAATVAASAVAAGVKPGADLTRTLKLIGDAATISGRDMTSMGAIFNKIAAAGKMTGQELNQLTDAGIPILQLLGDNLGMTASEVRDLVSAGKIGFPEFQDAIEKGMGGAALTMGQTFSGALANTKAAMSRLGKTFMDPFLKGITPALGTLTEIIDMVAEGTTEGLEEKTKLLGEQLIKMVNDVVKKLVPIIKNAIPIIAQLLTSLAKAIPKLLKELLPTVIDVVLDLANTIVNILPKIVPSLMKAIVQLATGLVKMIPQLAKIIIELTIQITKAVAKALPDLLPQIVAALMEIIPLIIENLPQLIWVGLQLAFGLLAGIVKAIPELIVGIMNQLVSVVKVIASFLPQKFKDNGKESVKKLGEGFLSMIEWIKTKAKEVLEKIKYVFWTLPTQFISLGINLIVGLWNGIKDKTTWIINKIKSFGSSVMKATKKIFGVHSPSTEFEWIGKMNVLGLEKGMEDMKNVAQETLDGVFSVQPNISSAMNNNLSPQINVVVNNDLEIDPIGQVVSKIKTFSGGAKNDYNWGATQ